MILDTLEIPIVLAPLAGGPATVDLAVAVSEAGGLGFLAAGYRTAADMRDQVRAFRARSEKPFGVNVFTSPASPAEPAVYASYVERLRREARRAGVQLGEPRVDDDDWQAKLAALSELAVPVVSFVFGCPSPEVIATLRTRGTTVWVNVTNPAEARQAEDAGADALVVQGYEAGGHRASFSDGTEPPYGLLTLLQLVGAHAKIALIAAGGVATGRGVAAVLAAGARAAQIGTAFCAPPRPARPPCTERRSRAPHRPRSRAPSRASPGAGSSTASCASTATRPSPRRRARACRRRAARSGCTARRTTPRSARSTVTAGDAAAARAPAPADAKRAAEDDRGAHRVLLDRASGPGTQAGRV